MGVIPVMTLSEFVTATAAGVDPQLWISTPPAIYRIDSVAFDPDGPVDSLPRVLAFTEDGDPITLRLDLSTPLFASAAEAHQEQEHDDTDLDRDFTGMPLLPPIKGGR